MATFATCIFSELRKKETIRPVEQNTKEINSIIAGDRLRTLRLQRELSVLDNTSSHAQPKHGGKQQVRARRGTATGS